MPDISIKKAALINAASKYSIILMNIFFSGVLARILTPYDYGIVAIISVFTAFFGILADMGLGTAVIQNKNLTHANINSIFTLSIFIGISLAGIFCLLAVPISLFYKNSVYISICCLLSLSILFNTFNMIPNAVLLRQKKFKIVAIRLVTINIITYGTTIILALLQFKYYALVIQSILSSFFTFTWNLKSAKIKPTKKIDWEIIQQIRSYSGYQFAFSFINYFARNLDKIIIGKALGNVSLAHYNRAYTLMLYPVQNLTHVITPALHPILSEHQTDLDYIYKKYIKIVQILALLGVYFTVACFCFSKEIILTIYGSQWIETIPCFRWLSISIFAQMVTSSGGAIFQSIGNTKLMFKSGGIAALVTMSFIIAGIIIGQNSLETVSLFIAAGFCCSFFINYYFLIHEGFSRSFSNFLSIFKIHLFIGSLCFASGFLLNTFILVDNLILALIIKVFLFTIIYSACTIIVSKQIRSKILFYLRPFIRNAFEQYLRKCKIHYGLNKRIRNQQIIISLTSYPARYATLFICIKSLLRQSMKADKIILTLFKDEAYNLPKTLLDLQKFGLTISYVDENLKPHKKYFYVMQDYPDALIITVDDDLMYDKHLVRDLYHSYKKYPYAVSARRVHKIERDKTTGLLKPYREWGYENTTVKTPSSQLFVTTGGGTLFPPHILPSHTFNIKNIIELCLAADDIWINFMLQQYKIPVVWIPHWPIHPHPIASTTSSGLAQTNVAHGQNDVYIQQLEKFFHFSIGEHI